MRLGLGGRREGAGPRLLLRRPPRRLQQPGLQEALQYLAGVLQHSPALTTLDLGGCQLSGPVVTGLCAALQQPGCRLQTLRWGRGGRVLGTRL